MISALGKEIIQRNKNEKQRFIDLNLSKLSANATAEEIEAVKALSAALYEQSQINSNEKSDVDKLIVLSDKVIK